MAQGRRTKGSSQQRSGTTPGQAEADAESQKKLAEEQTKIADQNRDKAEEQKWLARQMLYRSRIRLAQEAWRDGEIGQALEFLDSKDWQATQPEARIPEAGNGTTSRAFVPAASSTSRGTLVMSTASPSARTAAGSRQAAGTRPCDFGMRRRVG